MSRVYPRRRIFSWAPINQREANWEISNAVASCSGGLDIRVYLNPHRRGVTRKVQGQSQMVTGVAGQILSKETIKKALIKPNLIQI
jgi:hypothetical protein